MKIALFPNYKKSGTEGLLKRVIEIISDKAEYEVIDSSLDANETIKNADVVITIGGDGTLIKHSKTASVYGKKCLGINSGRLGFLANIDEANLDRLNNLFNGNYTVESRMMLSVDTFKNNECIYSGIALNDAVISSGSVARLTDILLDVSGSEIEYRADGIIVSTPTGSTAYAMSAGGPIIDPAIRGLAITPICSHSLTARPILTGEESVLTISLLESSRTNAYLTVDGKRSVEVTPDTKTVIKKSEFDAKLINLTGNTIYKTISLKF